MTISDMADVDREAVLDLIVDHTDQSRAQLDEMSTADLVSIIEDADLGGQTPGFALRSMAEFRLQNDGFQIEMTDDGPVVIDADGSRLQDLSDLDG